MASPQIKFGTDGWRGVVADDFTFGNVRRVAQATAKYMKSRSNDPLAIVGYDCRFASEDFAQAVSDVFASNGIKTLVFDRPSPTQVASWTVTELHNQRNPLFGGINPEPIPPNIDSTISFMKVGGQDLCICTDGDADRVGIIDETGRFINQLQVFALLMLYLFETRGLRGPVVKTVNMTSMIDKLGAEFGERVYEVPVGFKNIAPKMMETNALLGGEESGGFAVRGHIPERDGILIGLLFADMMVKTGKPGSQILAGLEQRVGPHAYARHDIHLVRETYDGDRKRILETLEKNEPPEA